MTDENDSGKKKGDGAAVTYVQTVNGYVGPDITLLASDLKAYTTTQSDTKFGQIASKTQRGQVIVGAGLTVDAQGVIGTNSSAPDWSAITNKPTEYPPTKAGTTVLGGVKVGAGLQITPDGTLYSSTAAPDWANITNKPAAYPPTTASATQIGGVKQGAGIFIDPATGTINATGSKPTWDSIEDKPVVFPPPVASATVLGGVIEGNNIEIAADGTISSYTEWDEILHKPAEFPPTVASASVRGGVFVGNGLEANESGVLSLSLARPNEIGGIIPGNTLATDAQSGRTDVVPASKDNFGAVKIGDTLYIDEVGDLQANPGAIQPATDTVLGGVKIGHGLKITEDGVLSNGAVNFVNRKEVYWGQNYPKEDSWTLPDGVDYFRVTCIGQGGWGNKSGGNANTNVGGGGGGSGGWAQALFYGYKFPKGQTFRLYFTSTNATYPNNAGDARFGIDQSAPPFILGGGGGHGEPGNSTNALANGFSQGGSGGAFDLGKSSDQYIITGFGRGQKGGNGFRVQGLSEGQTTWKTVAGIGAPSIHGGYQYGVACGAGAGATGSGDSNGNVERQFVGGNALIVIEW